MGPGGGPEGRALVGEGSPCDLQANPDSLTGPALSAWHS